MIVPSIDIQDGRAVQLRRGKEFVLDGGDPLDRLEAFSVAGEVAVIDLDAAMGKGSNTDLIRRMCRLRPIRVGGGIRTLDAALDWIDAGAARIIVGTAATESFCRRLPSERLIAAVDAVEGEVVVEGWQTRTGDSVLDRIERLAPHVGGFLLTQVEWEGGLAGFDMELVRHALARAGDARITAAGGIRSADDVAALDALDVDAQVGMAVYTGRLSLGEAIGAVLVRPVADRFWPTVVTDEARRVLGLVWSTRESIEAAVSERRGIYWSRSRDEIWRKGATSGNTQVLTRVDVDCDRDALRFTVRQDGVFCHTGTRSCFGDAFDISVLERVLRSRKDKADPDSGTFKLLRDRELLGAKLLEEAAELVEAVGSEAVTHEAADVLYFTLVALASAGVSFEDVVRELEFRHRRVRRRPMERKDQQ